MALATPPTRTTPKAPTQQRITESDADWQHLHAETVRKLDASLRQYVHDLRLHAHEPETQMAAFIHRHTRLLAEAYTTGHAHGVRDYYDQTSLEPEQAPDVEPDRDAMHKRMIFYAPSVAKMAREGVEAARAAVRQLMEADGYADTVMLDNPYPRGPHGHFGEGGMHGEHQGEGEGGGGRSGGGESTRAPRGGGKAGGTRGTRGARAPKEDPEVRQARLKQQREERTAARKAAKDLERMHAQSATAKDAARAKGENAPKARATRAPKAPKEPKTAEQLHAERLAKAQQKAEDYARQHEQARQDLKAVRAEHEQALAKAHDIYAQFRVDGLYQPRINSAQAAAQRSGKAALEARLQASSIAHETEGYREWSGDASTHPPFSVHDFEAAKFKAIGTSEGISESYTTTIHGQKYLIKQPTDESAMPGSSGRYEAHAEAAASEIAHMAGLDSTAARAWTFEHEGQQYVATEWKNAKPIGDGESSERRLARGLTDEQLSQLNLHEYLMGDADRHGGNLLYDPKTHEAYQIDFGRGLRLDTTVHASSTARDAWMAKHAKGQEGTHAWERMHFDRGQVERIVHAEPEIIRTMRSHGLNAGIHGMQQRIQVLHTLLQRPSMTYSDFLQSQDAVRNGRA